MAIILTFFFFESTRFKLLKWWAQSFIVGIPTVVCGYRNDRGIVTQLESIPIKDMPSMAKVSHFDTSRSTYSIANVNFTSIILGIAFVWEL